MDALWLSMTSQDWVVLGLIALVPVLMIVATYLIRSEIKQAAQGISVEPPGSDAPPLRLKTTETQREQWRLGKQRHPRAIIDLTDDVETLLRRVKAGSKTEANPHRRLGGRAWWSV